MTANFEKSVEINAPVHEVFAQWSDLNAYPRFMARVKNVRPVQENQWIWETEEQDWQMEVTQQLPQQAISWRVSTPEYTSTASVRFEPVDQSRTKVVYCAHYPNGFGAHHTALSVSDEMEQSLDKFARLLNGEEEPDPENAADTDTHIDADVVTEAVESAVAETSHILEQTLTTATQAWSSSMANAFDSFNALIWSPIKNLSLTAALPARTWSPRFEIRRQDDVLFVDSELPGYCAEDLHVEILDGRLLVSGQRQAVAQSRSQGGGDGDGALGEASEAPADQYLERFEESMPLNLPVDSKRVEAQVTPTGQLRIALPIKPEGLALA